MPIPKGCKMIIPEGGVEQPFCTAKACTHPFCETVGGHEETDDKSYVLVLSQHDTRGITNVFMNPRSIVPSFLLITDKGEPHHTIPMILHCPGCKTRHIDEGEFKNKAHHTHSCQECGLVWRPAKVNTHGVQFLPGYKTE